MQRITQIMPADGWWVEIAQSPEDCYSVRVVSWALVEVDFDGDPLTFVDGMVITDAGPELLDTVPGTKYFYFQQAASAIGTFEAPGPGATKPTAKRALR